MAKINEIAEIAGVSAATVSRVFNHHPNIRLEVRKRVFSVAREYGYHPRLTVKQKNVVVITPYDSVLPVQSCVDMILMALVQEMSERGFRLEILPGNNRERLDTIQFCAAVAIGTDPDEFRGWSERFAMPLIIMDREGDERNSDVYYVRSDESQGMRLALEHLYQCGCRKVGSIIHGSPNTGNATRRRDGIVRALAELGLPGDASLVCFSGPGSDKYMELIGKLLKQGIDALFCPGGNAGIVSLYAFSLFNRRVPEDISLIASEQSKISQYTVPPLTTIVPDYKRMAAATADLIEARVEGGNFPADTIFPYHLISRDSVVSHGL